LDEHSLTLTLSARLFLAIAAPLLVALIGFFVWLATISTRVTVLEETSRVQSAASKEVTDRIEHEREANDARVRDDLRELRARVFPPLTGAQQ
jgi:hypothetical protein